MAQWSKRTADLLGYAGLRTSHYYHTGTRVACDRDDSLAYYLDESERAYYRGPFDKEGVPEFVLDDRAVYSDALVSFYALGHLELYRRTGSQENLSTFVRIADWFASRQTRDGTWLTSFPMRKFGLPAGSPSAMIQGLAISILTRAFRITNKREYRECAVRGLMPFHRSVHEGGVTCFVNGEAFYEEYPVTPAHHVLNGFIYALWGLYDLTRMGNNEEAEALYDTGLKTLLLWLPRFDMGYWSLYHVSEGLKNPASVHYHRLHVSQLEIMYALTGNRLFEEYYRRWAGYQRRRFNALRTLPAKILWHLAYRPPAKKSPD